MNLTYIFHVDGDVVTGEVKELPGCTVKESSLDRCAVKLLLAQETWVDGWLQGARDRRLHLCSPPNPPTAPRLVEVNFATNKEAQDILNSLKDILASYDVVTLADYYSLCNIGSHYVDDKWGWASLDEASVVRMPNARCKIVFPQIIVVGRSE